MCDGGDFHQAEVALFSRRYFISSDARFQGVTIVVQIDSLRAAHHCKDGHKPINTNVKNVRIISTHKLFFVHTQKGFRQHCKDPKQLINVNVLTISTHHFFCAHTSTHT